MSLNAQVIGRATRSRSGSIYDRFTITCWVLSTAALDGLI